jgi:aspartate/glutamate racemase
VNCRLGKQYSADIVMISLDFESLLVPWREGNYSVAVTALMKAANQLEKAGAVYRCCVFSFLCKTCEK